VYHKDLIDHPKNIWSLNGVKKINDLLANISSNTNIYDHVVNSTHV
jgi:hypothetical protein